jgi:hypothetical protein
MNICEICSRNSENCNEQLKAMCVQANTILSHSGFRYDGTPKNAPEGGKKQSDFESHNILRVTDTETTEFFICGRKIPKSIFT